MTSQQKDILFYTVSAILLFAILYYAVGRWAT